MIRNKNENWFIGKLGQVLSRNPNITDIHELAIEAMRKQRHSDLNEYYLDGALAKMMVQKQISFKKVILDQKTLRSVPLAA